MKRPVCYDVTRLLTRVLNETPNGIDRIDFALAQHFLAGDPTSTFGSTATGVGSRLLGGGGAADVVRAIGGHWGESENAVGGDLVYTRVVRWLTGGTAPDLRSPAARSPGSHQAPDAPAPSSLASTSPGPIPPGAARRRGIVANLVRGIKPLGIARWVGRHGITITRTPAKALPQGSVYLNVSQFPLWVASSFEWLEARPDVRATFFIHDLLPVLMPEYFRAAEFERHRARLANVARFAAAAVVTTRTVASDLRAYMGDLGRGDIPVFVAPTPVSPTFLTPRASDPALQDHPFFVLCSTLEPRKNHLMILAVWRALVERLGAKAPKLVLVGTRGWHYDTIIDLIERGPALRSHVLEVGGLSTPGLKRLIDNARALLMPTFNEGYGLPVHEALAAGAPVVASDIPVFRDLAAPGLTLCSPLDGEAWLEAIAALSRAPRRDVARHAPAGWVTYFDALDGFLEGL